MKIRNIGVQFSQGILYVGAFMTTSISNLGPLSYTRVLFCRALSPGVTNVFYSYVNTQADQTANSRVIISPEFKKRYAEKRAKQEQEKIRCLRERAILDGLPKPGDRFYSASWEMLAKENKSKP